MVVTTGDGMVGVGAVGENKLAVQAVRTACALKRSWFPDGVLFADLFGYDDDRRRAPSAML